LQAVGAAPDLLICAPSTGFGGGIERVATAVERCWPGRCARVDLYRAARVAEPSGDPRSKVGFVARCLRQAASTRPDVVLSLHVGLLPVAHLVARVTRSEVALLGMGREVWGTLPAATRHGVRACHRLLAISDFTRDVLAQRADVRRERIAVTPPPVDDRILAAADAGITGVPDDPMLLTVSRVLRQHRYKGHFAVAKSLPVVLDQQPDARWIVVGDGDDLPALKAECKRLGVLDAVSFEQRVSDDRLAELYRGARALVMPSIADIHRRPPTGEGFGLVYAEAGAFGVPSIASSAGGGAAELVEDGVTGLTVRPGDSAALAGAMTELLTDGDLRRRLGGKARTRVMEQYVPVRFTQALREALAT
jgi:glycosyltransferase involved in cell wall biosynthesis